MEKNGMAEERCDAAGTLVESERQDSGGNLDEELFSMFPEGTRIFIKGNQVTFENLTPDLLSVAQSLNPGDETLRSRGYGDGKTRKT